VGHDVSENWVNFSPIQQAMLRFRRMRTLQKFVAVHGSVHNHFNAERHLYNRSNFKLNSAAALAEWRGLCTV
jgi:putative transposase